MIQKTLRKNDTKKCNRKLAQKIQIKNWHKKLQLEIDTKVCQKINVKAKWHKKTKKKLPFTRL